MSLKIELEPAGPGSAHLLIGEVQGVPERVALAIQRNNGNWLGPNRQWQVTPHWHPQFSAEPRPEGLRLAIGSDLVDSIIDAGGSPLLVRVRSDGLEDAGVLRMRGELVGSGAAVSRPLTPDTGDTVILESPVTGNDAVLSRPHPETSSLIHPSTSPSPASTMRFVLHRILRWMVLAAAVLIAVASFGAWYFGLVGGPEQAERAQPPVDEGVADAPQPEPKHESLSPTPPAPEVQPKPALEGIAFARDFLSGQPAAEAIFARAEQAEKEGDCPAAYALYSGAANKAPALAARLARRYDPQTHTPGPCIGAPDIPYAIVYYNDAADTGDVAVQRRLGQLMVEREPSGPTRQAGLQWLRKASEAGDAEARNLLEKLADR